LTAAITFVLAKRQSNEDDDRSLLTGSLNKSHRVGSMFFSSGDDTTFWTTQLTPFLTNFYASNKQLTFVARSPKAIVSSPRT
jgi:hypothetical protein